MEERRQTLTEENERAERRLEQARAEVSACQTLLDNVKIALPSAQEDDVLRLNVGGQRFETYRSTLTQFKDSVLGTMVSARWAAGCTQDDGSLFLDMDADDFKDILTFLRHHRLDPSATAEFTKKAATLARFLGIPVDSVIDTKHITWLRREHGDSKKRVIVGSFMFDVFFRGSKSCRVKSFDIMIENSSRITIYSKFGSFSGEAMSDAAKWREVCSMQLVAGRNLIRLLDQQELRVLPHGTTAVYLSFDQESDLHYTGVDTPPTYVSEDRTDVEMDMQLVCGPGRLRGITPFSDGCHVEDRWFLGAIEYSIDL